jgi:predicted oxidoreductase
MICPQASMQEGLSLSRVIAGMWRLADWNLDIAQRLNLIHGCIDRGVSSFDLADIYGDYQVEQLFGEALTRQPGLRNRLSLISKCGIKLCSPNRPEHRIKHYDTSSAHILASVESSLRKLGTDHLDLLLIHRPDPLMQFDEVARTFEQCRKDGKVLHFGVSNFSQRQFEALNARIPLQSNQVEFSPLNLEAIDNGVFDGLQHQEIKPMIWSALAGGRLFNPDMHTSRLIQTIHQVAEELGLSPVATIYAWIMRLPSQPLVLTGSQRLEVITEAVSATTTRMDIQSWFAILEAARGHEVA